MAEGRESKFNGADRGWTTTDAWTSRCLTNEISYVHTKTVFTQLQASVNRFSGWFYVTPERAGSWHFWGNWDDNCMLTVDGVDAGFDGLSSSRGFDAKVDFDLAEGWHRFEFRTRDISGGYGPWTGAEAIKVRINDGDWILFDERNFQLMPYLITSRHVQPTIWLRLLVSRRRRMLWRK